MKRSLTSIRNASFDLISKGGGGLISLSAFAYHCRVRGREFVFNRRLAQASFVIAVVFGLLVLPGTAFAKSSCLLAEQDTCVLKTDYQGLKVQVDERGKIVVVFGNSKEEFVRAESYVNVQEDLARLEAADDIEPGESAQITNDLVKYDGAIYAIPDSSELRSALGFPSTAAVTADDYLDLIRVHMQLVLSLSASAAGYLSDLLGVEAIDSIPAAVAETPKAVDPVAATIQTQVVPPPVAVPIVMPLPMPAATPEPVLNAVPVTAPNTSPTENLAIPNRN